MQARPLARRVGDGDVHGAVGHALEQLLGQADFGVQRQVGRTLAHPQQPVAQQRVPQGDLATHRHHGAAAGGHGQLALGPLPDLYQGQGVAHELLARGGQRSAGLAAHEQLAAQ